MSRTVTGERSRESRGAVRLANRIANPAIAAILRSPAHRVLSGSIALITVRGRKTGRAYTFPVQYARTGTTLCVVPGGYRRKTWWRNLREPAPVRIRLEGRDVDGIGQVLFAATDPDTVADALSIYQSRFPSARCDDAVVLIDLDRAQA